MEKQRTPEEIRSVRDHLRRLKATILDATSSAHTTAAVGILEVLVAEFDYRLVVSGGPWGFRLHVTTDDGREISTEDASLIEALTAVNRTHLASELLTRTAALSLRDRHEGDTDV